MSQIVFGLFKQFVTIGTPPPPPPIIIIFFPLLCAPFWRAKKTKVGTTQNNKHSRVLFIAK